MSAVLKVPKNTQQSGEKGLGQGGDQEPDGHSDRARVILWRWEKLPEGQPSLQFSTNQAFCGRVARGKQLLSKRHLKDPQTMRNKILWSDESKLELFGLNAKGHVWRKPGSIPTVKHGGGSIMLWGCF